MNIYIYSDESGVFDQKHNDFFVFGGLVFLDKESRDNETRKYMHVERVIRDIERIADDGEIKASRVSNKSKNKIYRSLNQIEKFGIVVHQKQLSPELFDDKKGKQRYLDWAYKIAVKRKFQRMIREGVLNPNEVENLYFYVDEHHTATNGLYELRESLESEFKYGTYRNWVAYIPPIFPNLKRVEVKFCNSQTTTLVRAADIVANKLYYLCTNSQTDQLADDHFHITHHPFGT